MYRIQFKCILFNDLFSSKYNEDSFTDCSAQFEDVFLSWKEVKCDKDYNMENFYQMR